MKTLFDHIDILPFIVAYLLLLGGLYILTMSVEAGGILR
jgi:hypothetical protein